MPRIGIVLLLLPCALGACPKTNPTAAPDGSADGAMDVGGADLPGDAPAPACNALDLAGAPAVTLMQIASNAPAAAGGEIAPGTYYLTGYAVYTRPGGASGPLPLTIKARHDFTADTLQAIEADGDGSNVVRYTSSYTTAGTQFTETRTCARTVIETSDYTATPSAITRWAMDQGLVVEIVLTKQ